MRLSFEEIRTAIYTALEKAYPGKGGVGSTVWVESVYDDEVIYHNAGKMFKADYSIGNDAAATIGNATEVKKKVTYQTIFSDARILAAFSSDEDGEMVTKRGKIFEAGDYPDKGVSFDEDDLEAAASDFTEVLNDLEHRPTVLDGKLGQLKKVWRVGKELHGELTIPKWFTEVVGDEAIKVSLSFNRDKRINGNALVLRPRISDAAVMSAFTAFNSQPPEAKEPQSKMPKTTIAALMASLGVGDLSKADPSTEIDLPVGFSMPAPTPPAVTPPPVQNPTSEAPETTVFNARLESMEKQLAQFSKVAVDNAAISFADSVIRANKVLPAQRDQVADQYRSAVLADANGGPQFTDGVVVSGQAVESLTKFYENTQPLPYSAEAINGGETAVLFANHSPSTTPSEDRINHLLSLTPVGQQAKAAVTRN